MKVEITTEAKVEITTEAKVEITTEAKVEITTEAKVEITTEAKGEKHIMSSEADARVPREVSIYRFCTMFGSDFNGLGVWAQLIK